jgi:hypothetical protein
MLINKLIPQFYLNDDPDTAVMEYDPVTSNGALEYVLTEYRNRLNEQYNRFNEHKVDFIQWL